MRESLAVLGGAAGVNDQTILGELRIDLSP
jgi:hypothetical protein